MTIKQENPSSEGQTPVQSQDPAQAQAQAPVRPPPSSRAIVQMGRTLLFPEPIVVKLKGKRKKRRRSSRGLKGVEKLNRGMSKASRRLSRAVAKGLDKYVSSSDKSAEKRRDGALIDMRRNMARAMGTTLSRSGKAFDDVAKSFSRKDNKRQVRAMARILRPWAR